MLNLECVEPTRKRKRELDRRRPEWATAHCEASVAIGLPGRCVPTGYSLSRQGAHVRHTTGPVCARQACVSG